MPLCSGSIEFHFPVNKMIVNELNYVQENMTVHKRSLSIVLSPFRKSLTGLRFSCHAKIT